jgi:integrase
MSDRITVDRGCTLFWHHGSWWVDLSQDGTRTRRNLGTTDKHRALTIAREIAADILARRWNVAAASELTIETALAKYRASLEYSELAPGTKENTDRALNRFAAWLSDQRLVALERMTREHVENYARHCETAKAHRASCKREADCACKRVSRRTVNGWISRIASALSWLRKRGYLRANPAANVSLKVPPSLAKPALTPAEIARLVQACENETLRDLIVLLANTALRISEALALRGRDVKAAEGTLAVLNRKANRYDLVALNEAARVVALRRSLAAGPDGLLFTTSTGAAMNRRNVRRDLVALGARCGVRITGPHQLRRSACTEAARYMTPAELKEFARHKDVRTTHAFYVDRLAPVPPVVVAAPIAAQ